MKKFNLLVLAGVFLLGVTFGLGKISQAEEASKNLKFMREQIQNILNEIDALGNVNGDYWNSYNNVTRGDLKEDPYAVGAAAIPANPAANGNGNNSLIFNQYAGDALKAGNVNGNYNTNDNANKNGNDNLPEIPQTPYESYAPTFTPDPNSGGQGGDQKKQEEDEMKKMLMQLLAQIIQGILGKGQEKTGGGAGGGDQATKAQ